MSANMLPRYVIIASTLQAYLNCVASGNKEWEENHADHIRNICDKLPHGGGFDSGCRLNVEESTSERLVFEADFHHMNQHGYYDGWTHHLVIVTASLTSGYAMRITGRDRNEIKDYIADCFSTFLSEKIDRYADSKPKRDAIVNQAWAAYQGWCSATGETPLEPGRLGSQ